MFRLYNILLATFFCIFSCAPAIINYHPSDNQNGVETRFVDVLSPYVLDMFKLFFNHCECVWFMGCAESRKKWEHE